MIIVLAAAMAACTNSSSDFGPANPVVVGDGVLTPIPAGAPPAQPVEGTVNHLVFVGLDDTSESSLAEHLDKPLVVNFFAAWCAPCRAELPDFETVYGELREQVNFLGVSRDPSAGPSLDLLTETGVSFPTGWDMNGGLFSELGLLAMPSTLFVDSEGFVAETWSGVLTADNLRSLINEHLL